MCGHYTLTIKGKHKLKKVYADQLIKKITSGSNGRFYGLGL